MSISNNYGPLKHSTTSAVSQTDPTTETVIFLVDEFCDHIEEIVIEEIVSPKPKCSPPPRKKPWSLR